MKKAFVSKLLIVILSLNLFNMTVYATKEVDISYDQNSLEQAISSYGQFESTLNLLSDSDNFSYWLSVKNYKEKKITSWLTDAAASITGNDIKEEDYVRILTTVIELNQITLAQQTESESTYDDLKTFLDYAKDVLNMSGSFIDDENVKLVYDTSTDSMEFILNSVEQGTYFQMIIQNYESNKDFLETINSHATIDGLKDAAAKLLDINTTLFEKRMEYMTKSLKNVAEFEAKWFLKNLTFKLLKESDTYTSDVVMKWAVDTSESIIKAVSNVLDLGKFVFRMMTLAGDLGFATSDNLRCYEEIKVYADMAQAVCSVNEEIEVYNSDNYENQYENILKKCSWYNWLITIHARGEYLQHLMLTNDKNTIALMDDIITRIRGEKTYDDWYNGQINSLDLCQKYIDAIYGINIYSQTIINESYDPESIYKGVINEYREALANGSSMDGASIEQKYPNVNPIVAMYYQPEDKIYYAYYDIDGNGILEMVVGKLDENMDSGYVLYNLYAFDGKQVVNLHDDSVGYYGDRGTLNIYTDGSMYVYGYYGNRSGIAKFYKLAEDGFSLDLIKEYEEDGYLYPETPFYNETEKLSYEELNAKLSDKTNCTFEWKDLNSISTDSENVDANKDLYEIFLNCVSDEEEIYYIYDDFDNDKKYEAYGITGIYNSADGLYNNVYIYYISSDGSVIKVNQDNALYGYLGSELLDTGSAKFIVWEVSANGSGSSSYIYGVKNGQSYEPEISREYMCFGKSSKSDGVYSGETSDFSKGSHAYIEHCFFYDTTSHEFIEMD